jgi:hypothetical protein
MRWKDRELKSFILEEDWIFVTQSVSIFAVPWTIRGQGAICWRPSSCRTNQYQWSEFNDGRSPMRAVRGRPG